MKINAGQAASTLIPEYIGSAFDKVITVADNIEAVIGVANCIEGAPVISYIGETAPEGDKIAVGSEWYCTADGRTYVLYEDDDSLQWVESSPQSSSSVPTGKMTLNVAATDAATTTALVNQIRAELIAIGLAQ